MQILRNAHLLARFVLVWFALSLGVAVASPIVNPQNFELICSSAGVMKLVVQTDDGAKAVSGQMLDCPLCATGGAPPPSFQVKFEPLSPLGHVLQSIPSAIMAALTAAPPPARGPPTFF
ncbi:MAG: hypothetical protein Q8K22_00625 [Rhodoferax sp.]|nr:hypothetical protein [Rhodoferax sp.]